MIDPGLAVRALRHLDDDDYEIVIRVRRRDIEGAIEVELEAVRPQFVEPATWKERLWTTHPETRLDMDELSEALGKSKKWIYRRVSADTIPHRKLGGELMFVVGQIRTWLEEQT